MEDDKISYIVFNKETMVVFDMAQKLVNTTFSKTAIRNYNDPHGRSAVYDALTKSMKQFPRQPMWNVHTEKRVKWIILVVSGPD